MSVQSTKIHQLLTYF